MVKSCSRAFIKHALSHLYIFDFELSYLGRKHFAKNIVNSIGVSTLCN